MVKQGSTHAVFAETALPDPELVDKGGEIATAIVAAAFDFSDANSRAEFASAIVQVSEFKLIVDGYPFLEIVVNQGKPDETVSQHGEQFVGVIGSVPAQEGAVGFTVDWFDFNISTDPGFYGFPLIIFSFYFKKLLFGIHIVAKPDLMPVTPAIVMYMEHPVIGGVEVRGFVKLLPVAIDFEDPEIADCRFEQGR